MDGKNKLINRPIIRVLILWVIQTLALILMVLLLDGLDVDRVGTAVLAVALIGMLNAVLWPLLSFIIIPFAVFTLGFITLVLNGFVIWLAGQIIEGFTVANLWTAVLASLGMTAINVIASSLLTIDDESSWYRNVIKRRMKRRSTYIETNVPGVFFLEIDGLAKPILEKAIREGYAPTIKRWIEEGSHKLIGWETDLSSQTSASQAGILHGNNTNIPAFRWFDRSRGEIVSSSDPKFVAEIERRHSNGQGLLVNSGASRGNLVSGDAQNVMLTASTVMDFSRFHTKDFATYFLDPYNFTRTLLMTLWDIILEIRQYRKARRNNVYPLLDKSHRGGKYPLLRAFTTVIMRDINIYTLIGDMYAGVPVAYATFVGYDEVAHHSGIETVDAFDALQKLDHQFSRLERAAQQAPRPYHFVVLSDHGQTGGATFKQRYNLTLEELVQKLASEKYSVQGAQQVHEDWKHLNVFLTETIQHGQNAVSRPLGKLLEAQSKDGEVTLGPEAALASEQEGNENKFAHLVALASGNLGLIYSTRLKERAHTEEITKIYPGLLEGLVNHEGIGFVLVHSREYGPVVIGEKGRNYLRDNRIEGENPLENFGDNAASHLRRTDTFPDAPDILVNSFYESKTGEGAAFEELIGFHGGLGGYQTQPFLLSPIEWELENKNIVGAEQVFAVLKGKLSELQGDETS